jgi:AcrR family transcriptional regulator
MESVDARDQPAASPRPSLAVTAFPYLGRSDMTTGGAARARRLLDNFAWGTRTIGSRSTQWAAYVEFCGLERRAIVPASESQLVAYVGSLAMEREAGRRSVSAASLPQYLSAVRVICGSLFIPWTSPGTATAEPMPILQALVRAYAQWEAQAFPQLTNRGGIPADVIQEIWRNGMESALPAVVRDAAAVVTAYVLGLRESSVMSLPEGSIVIDAERMTCQLVLVKGCALRRATPVTYVRTGAAGLPSPIDLVQRWTARRRAHALLFGMSGDASEWQRCSLSAALGRALAAVSRGPPPGTSWTSHSLRIGSHTEQTLLGFQRRCGKQDLGGDPTAMT